MLAEQRERTVLRDPHIARTHIQDDGNLRRGEPSQAEFDNGSMAFRKLLQGSMQLMRGMRLEHKFVGSRCGIGQVPHPRGLICGPMLVEVETDDTSATTVDVRHHIVGNGEQPAAETGVTSFWIVATRNEAIQGVDEYLGGRVSGFLRINDPSLAVAMHGVEVAIVNPGKRLWIADGIVNIFIVHSELAARPS